MSRIEEIRETIAIANRMTGNVIKDTLILGVIKNYVGVKQESTRDYAKAN